MHELALAYNIVTIVSDYAKNEKALSVNKIDLQVGKISGVEVDALKFSLELAIKGTQMENAFININYVQGKAKCRDCLEVFEIEDLLTPCPICHTFNSEILEGKELSIISIEIP